MATMGDDAVALLPYRMRTVKVGLLTTALGLAALAVYAFLPGHTVEHPSLFAGLLGLGFLGMGVIALLPWERLFAGSAGLRLQYAWSVLDIGLITAGVQVTGGSSSDIFILYTLTTLFFGASYPSRGRVALTAFTAASYLTVVAIDSDPVAATVFIQLCTLTLLALITGFLSDELMTQIGAHHKARMDSEERASMLATVAAAGRAMSTPDADLSLETVVLSAVEIGFTGAEICRFDGDVWFQTNHGGGIITSMADPHPASSGLAGRVRRERRTVVIDDYAEWTDGVPEVRQAGMHLTIGVPIWVGADLAGVLIAGTDQKRSQRESEMECLELLATQAGSALVNANRYAEREAFEARLTHQAFHDALTGLPNRALFVDRLEHAQSRARRGSGELAVLFLDLDRFKTINDSLGHDIGDMLLVQVGARLEPCLRPGDTLARYGGDEFTALIEDAGADQALLVAERIMEALQRPFHLGGREIYAQVSIGIAVADQARPDADPLREADLAMYRAKDKGRHQWQLFEPSMNDAALRRLEDETELGHAVERQEFYLSYQPIVAIDSGLITGVEALARWEHPRRGTVSPDEFIPLAEETGLILALGDWVLTESVRQAVEWKRLGYELDVHVNVSAIQMQHRGLVEKVASVLKSFRMEPERLVIEVTETVVMEDVEEMIGVMVRLQSLGVRLAMDDFGRGNSSLAHLKRFPLQVVKIDKVFVDGLVINSEDRAVIRSVVLLAAELGMHVTAEGIESEAQLNILRELGCDSAQGYHLSRPVQPSAIPVLIERGLGPANDTSSSIVVS